MFKRLRWMTMGTGVGLGLAVWGQRKVRARLSRYQPARVTAELTDGARRLGESIRVAADEGRAAMSRREAELRDAHRGPDSRSVGPRGPEGVAGRMGEP